MISKEEEQRYSKALYWFLWGVQRSIDAGGQESLEVIEKQCEDGTIFEYIAHKYNPAMFSRMDIEATLVNELYQKRGIDVYDLKNRYEVNENGLVALSVLAIEWLYLGFKYLIEE